MIHKVAIITCYIGRFPEWFNLWIKSCEMNSEFHFIVFTDQILERKMPSNVQIVTTSLEILQKQFSETLGFDCELSTAYKLCDYKVIYGITFKEYLNGYDFWGHCDIDMIFGNLLNFISDEILDTYDRVFEVGHLSLYRNNEYINSLYKEPYGLYSFEMVYNNKYYMGFDEHTGVTRIFHTLDIPTYSDVVCADIDPHYRMFVCMDEDSAFGKMTVHNSIHQIFAFENGFTYRYFLSDEGQVERQEVSYIHFMRKYPKVCVDSEYSKFIITNSYIKPFDIIDPTYIIINDNSVQGIERKMEYLLSFVKNGLIAFRRGNFIGRVVLRFGRIKFINNYFSKIK